jgi:ribosomal protein S30
MIFARDNPGAVGGGVASAKPRVDAKERGAHPPRPRSQLMRQRFLELIERADRFQIIAGAAANSGRSPVAQR